MPLRRHSRIHASQSKSFAEQRRRQAIIGIVAGSIAIFSFTFSLSKLSSLEFFSIETIRVYGADSDIALAVQSAAYNSIQGSFLGIFSKSNAFIYPKSSLTAAVVDASPRVLSAEVSRDGWQTLIVSVYEKSPAAIVCADLPDFDQNGALLSDNDCYAADDSGLLFKKITASTDAFAGTASAAGTPGIIRYYVPDLPDDASAIGSRATSTVEFAALQSFVAGARSAGIKPEAILFKDGGEYEMYADSPAGPSGAATSTPLIVVYFNDKAGFAAELSDFHAFWSHMAMSAAGAPKSFEYIDLRYGSNVFYR